MVPVSLKRREGAFFVSAALGVGQRKARHKPKLGRADYLSHDVLRLTALVGHHTKLERADGHGLTIACIIRDPQLFRNRALPAAVPISGHKFHGAFRIPVDRTGLSRANIDRLTG